MFSNQNTASTGLFSQQNNQSFAQPQTQSQGMFGNNPQQSSAPSQGGLFGNGGQSTGAFGAASNNQAAFLGGGNSTSTSSFSNPTQSAFGQSSTQGGLFGQQPSSSTGTGMFGQTTQQQPQQQQGGIFGNQGGLSQGTQGQGLFSGGGQQTSTQQTGFFGQQGNQSTSGGGSQFGSFNKTSQPYTSQSTGVFGGSTSQGGGGIFGAAGQQQQQQSPNIQSTGIFAKSTNPTQPANQGGLFGTFAPSNPTQGTSMFQTGGTTQGNNNSVFGTSGMNMNGNNNTAANNKLVGTSWGVPTNQPNTPAMQPIRSKNPKLDAKHLVKCIAAMEQFQGCCKEEIRINFLQSGGQQPAINQPQQQTQGSAGFAKPTTTNPLTTIPSFGGSTNLGAPQSTVGGGQSTLFGGSKPTQSTGMFGTTQPSASTGTGLFGTQAQPNPYNSPQSSLLGGTQPQQTGLFGTTTPSSQPSLFGATPQGSQPQSTLFGGAQPQSTLFGGAQTTPLQAPPSLMPTIGGNPNPTTSPLFGGQPAAQATPQLAPNPLNGDQSTFSSLMAPFFQPNQQMDPSMQLLLPQLLFNSAMAQSLQQNQNQGQNAATPGATSQSNPWEIMSKLFASMGQNKGDENKTPSADANSNSAILNQTPFDEFMKEQNEKVRPSEKHTLFSQAEIRQFEDLDTKSYLDRIHHPHQVREEQFRIRHSYQPQERRVDPLQANFKIISRNYKNSQDQARKKYTPKPEELPDFGNFTVSPSMDKLKNMAVNQLKSVQNVKISNSFGTVEFLQPISLYKLDISSAIKIAQDNIEILDLQLQQKRVRMTFANFGNYSVLKPDERVKLLKRMRNWINQCDMIEINHDAKNGQLVVETLD